MSMVFGWFGICNVKILFSGGISHGHNQLHGHKKTLQSNVFYALKLTTSKEQWYWKSYFEWANQLESSKLNVLQHWSCEPTILNQIVKTTSLSFLFFSVCYCMSMLSGYGIGIKHFPHWDLRRLMQRAKNEIFKWSFYKVPINGVEFDYLNHHWYCTLKQ